MWISMVNWFWLLLLVVVAINTQKNHAIQVYPEPATAQKPQLQATTNATLVQPTAGVISANKTQLLAEDSELSASERNRRLIPYMAFYLPAPEFPINQQYAIQKPQHEQQHQQQPTASGGNLRIPLPTAYVHMKVPAAATGPEYHHHHQPHHQQQQHHQRPQHYHANAQPQHDHYPPSAGELYQTIAYGGQHPISQQPQPHEPHFGKPLTVERPIAGNNNGRYRPPINKQKTVQHFPPLSPAELQQHQQQQQQQPQPQPQHHYTQHHVQRPRTKPAGKHNNLSSPFTPDNTVPGHFVPIVFTPSSSNDNNENNSNNNNGNNINYNDEHEQHQQQREHHKQQAAAPQLPPAETHVQFFEVTLQASPAPPAVPPPSSDAAPSLPTTSNLIYHSNNDEQHYQHHFHPQTTNKLAGATTLTQQQQQPQQPQQSLQYIPHRLHKQTKRPQIHLRPSSPKYEQQQQQVSHAMTPQQKYVMYLQQRAQYNQQQQDTMQQQHEQLEDYANKLLHEHEQQPAQSYVPSSTPVPVHVSPKAAEEQEQYPQHSPIRHTAYARPEMRIPPNHQAIAKQRQQEHVVQIPVQAMVNHVDKLVQQQYYGFQQQPQSYDRQQHGRYKSYKNVSPSPYTDFAIEEPKQSLDEEHHHDYPQHFILVTTPEPPHSQSPAPTQLAARPRPSQPTQQPLNREHFIASARPIYQRPSHQPRQPTKLVHLQSDERRPYEEQQYSTRRPPASSTTPSYAYSPTTSATVTATAATIAITPPSPTAPIKLKPSYKYATLQQQQQQEQREHDEREHAAQMELVEQYKQRQQEQLQQQQQQPIPYSQHHVLPATSRPQFNDNQEQNQLPDISTSSLTEILHKLQESNHLPQTLTPDNIDNSIKTLITILNNLKSTQAAGHKRLHAPQPAATTTPPTLIDYDYASGAGGGSDTSHADLSDLQQVTSIQQRPGPNSGRAGVDYPNYSSIPETSFDCNEQRYKGFFGDPETNCQVWHYCDLNGGKASFLCPNGTIFSQIALTCDWWFNVKCSQTAQLYVLNERLYKYILPFTPKFPEDYSGPLVDQYLAMKYQEMEEKMRQQKLSEDAAKQPSEDEHDTENHIDQTATLNASNEDVADDLETITVVPETTPTPRTVIISSTPMKHLISINSQVHETSPERNRLIDDEIDDIEQRDSPKNTYESSSTSSPTHEPSSFHLKPIIVTSTVRPQRAGDENDDEHDAEENVVVIGASPASTIRADDDDDDEEDDDIVLNLHEHLSKLHETRSTEKSTVTNGNSTSSSNRDLPKMYVSVEKVEVIEIKPDGSSGHILPDILFKDDNTKKKR